MMMLFVMFIKKNSDRFNFNSPFKNKKKKKHESQITPKSLVVLLKFHRDQDQLIKRGRVLKKKIRRKIRRNILRDDQASFDLFLKYNNLSKEKFII